MLVWSTIGRSFLLEMWKNAQEREAHSTGGGVCGLAKPGARRNQECVFGRRGSCVGEYDRNASSDAFGKGNTVNPHIDDI